MSTLAQLPSDNLRSLRLAAGLTRDELAAAANVSPTTILNAERRAAMPRLATQKRVAAALDRALRLLGEESPIYPRRLTHLDLWPEREVVA